MKKRSALFFCSVALFCLVLGAIAASAQQGGSHHPQPNHPQGGGSCGLGSGFHNYDPNSFGPDRNIWCNGANQQLRPHEGSTVNAKLASGDVFVGGFCIQSHLVNGRTLDIRYQNLVKHDKVWLKSKDQIYYPIDKPVSDNFILVEDNGWADQNPAPGRVTAEVLLSQKSSSGGGGGSGGGGNSGGSDSGGGCNGFGVGALFLLSVIPVALLRRKNG